jgi:uncharacterized protein YcfJ
VLQVCKNKLFAKKQFVRDEQLVAGGAIQVIVCNYIKICERNEQYSGMRRGKETVRTPSEKRQAAQIQ